MPGSGRPDVSPSQADMQWRTRVGCEEFWATFPVFSPRPEIHTEGLIPIKMETSHVRELLGTNRGKQSGFGGDPDPDKFRRTTSSIKASEAMPPKPSSRQSSIVASQRSSHAAAALMLDHRLSGDLREQLQQERVLRHKAEVEARQLREKLAAHVA
eukprot:symbB.v1.2.013467.t1/scaffold951.1/size304340/7